MKITPIADLKPIKTTSLRILPLISLVVTLVQFFFSITILPMVYAYNVESPLLCCKII